MVGFKLRTAFLGYALLSAISVVQGQQSEHECVAEDSFFDSDNTPQTAFTGPDNFRVTCEAIAKSVSPSSHVFYPGACPEDLPMAFYLFPLCSIRDRFYYIPYQYHGENHY
jgi:hypothetical protein